MDLSKWGLGRFSIADIMNCIQVYQEPTIPDDHVIREVVKELSMPDTLWNFGVLHVIFAQILREYIIQKKLEE